MIIVWHIQTFQIITKLCTILVIIKFTYEQVTMECHIKSAFIEFLTFLSNYLKWKTLYSYVISVKYFKHLTLLGSWNRGDNLKKLRSYLTKILQIQYMFSSISVKKYLEFKRIKYLILKYLYIFIYWFTTD